MALISRAGVSSYLNRLASRINGDRQMQNLFAKAFYSLVGASYTRYDSKGPTYIEEGYNINPHVYAVIQQMATKTSSVPYDVKIIKDEQTARKLRRETPDLVKQPFKTIERLRMRHKAFEEKVMPMPLDKPNPRDSWEDLWAMYKTFIRTTGNAYFYMLRPEDGSNAGVPLQLYILPSHLMNIVLHKNADLLLDEDPVDYYMLIEGDTYVEFPAEDVIHVKLPNPNFDYNGHHLYGQSPLSAALKNIQSTNEALDQNINTMANGGAFGIIHGKGPEPLSDEEAKQLKNRLIEMRLDKGVLSNYAGVGVEVGFTKLSLTTEELRPFDYLQFDQKTICNVLGWSDKLLNSDEGAKYDNVSQFRKQVVTDNIVPDLNLLSQALNERFFPLFKNYQSAEIYFDVLQLPEMQQDTEKLVGWMSGLVDRGVITRNEMRAAISYNTMELPEMDILTVTTPNMLPLEDAVMTQPETITVEEVEDAEEEKRWIKAGFDPNQPRGSDGRWIDAGGGSAGGPEHLSAQADAHKEFGGSTYDQNGKNMVGAKGMAAVSIYPEKSLVLEGNEMSEELLAAYYTVNAEFLAEDTRRMVGTWYDSENDLLYFDISLVAPRDEAIQLGIDNNQKAVWDLEMMDEIDTGGDGTVKQMVRRKIRAVLNK